MTHVMATTPPPTVVGGAAAASRTSDSSGIPGRTAGVRADSAVASGSAARAPYSIDTPLFFATAGLIFFAAAAGAGSIAAYLGRGG